MEATPTGNVGPSRTDPFTSKVIIDAPSAALEKGAGAALIAALGPAESAVRGSLVEALEYE